MLEIAGVHFYIPEFLIIPLFILVVSVFIFQNTNLIIRNKTFLEVCLFSMGAFFVSIMLSYYNALDEIAVFISFLKWVEIFGLSLLVFLYCSSLKRFKHIWWLLLLVLLFDISFGLTEVFTEAQSNFYWGLRQIPGYSALFLLALVLPFSERRFSISFASLFLVTLVILSLSRGAWLGLLVMCGYWLWKTRYKIRLLLRLVFLVSFISLLFFIFPPLTDAVYLKIQNALNLESISNIERLGMAIAALNLFLRNPLVGIGAENFPDQLLKHGIPPFVTAQNPDKLTPHNFFLQIAAENGIIGLLAILGWLWSMYKILFQSNILSSSDYLYLYGLRLLFIAMIISLLFGYVSGSLRMQVGLYTGLVLASLRVFPEYHKSVQLGI